MQPGMTVVAEAANGAQAVELYRKFRPDVTLMDMRIPALSGVETARPSIPIFPSAHHRTQHLWRRRRHPPCAPGRKRAYLTKDVLHDELIRAIRAVHSGRTYLTAAVRAVSEPGHRPPI